MAVRGATTCDEDSKAEIDRKTQELVKEMLTRNNIDHDDYVGRLGIGRIAQGTIKANQAIGHPDLPSARRR